MNDVKKERTMKDSEIIRRTLTYIRPHKKKFILAIIFMLFVIALELMVPYLSGLIIGKLSHPENTKYLTILALSIGYLGSILTSLFFMYFETMILQKAGQSIVYQLREDVFHHIESLSIDQINSIPIGKLVSRVTSDTNAINDLYTNILINLLKNILSLFGIFAMMLALNYQLALYMLIFVPVVGGLSYAYRALSKKAYRRVRHSITSMNAFLNENLSGMKITQIFHQEKRKENEFIQVNEEVVKARSKQNIIFAIFRPIISFLYFGAIATLIYVSIYRLELGTTETGVQVIWSFYECVGRFFGPIQTLADQVNGLQQAFAASERLFLLLDLKPSYEDDKDAIEMPPIHGDIQFDHVWFAYEEENWILRDVSFTIKAGETVAFVGATGAGKTTILSLLTRNYDVQKGAIYIDGIDIKKVKIQSLRKQIGQMLQDVFLFSGTIHSNISLRDDDIPNDKIEKAASFVGANQFIEKLPLKYDEPVLEKGSNFSIGQRQLLSFARTMVHEPKMLILDEATANIDTETELLIQQSLEKMMSMGTMLIVAHRLSTIQHADKIIVLQNGKIIEEGTHQALLKEKGYYYNLYRLQFENE
ncbi:MAG: ABC transporter ATP-binding protein [Coprobacillus sp.]|nr:ABC transporter ATP-binding protein [Coprobacillus sp.]